MQASIEIVWFKRDLRVVYHEALFYACESAHASDAALLALYVIEPSIWLAPDASWRQWQFVEDSLNELQTDLGALGIPLLKAYGEMPQVLQVIASQFAIKGLWSHQETGNAKTFARDLAVKAFCKTQQIPWQEFAQQPIRRAGINRDYYHAMSQAFFERAPLAVPVVSQALQQRNQAFAHQAYDVLESPLRACEPLPQSEFWQTLQARAYPHESTQRGGRKRGEACLQRILRHRAKNYLATLAKPVEGARFSSRLSPHLAWGSLSIREVIHALMQAIRKAAEHELPTKELRALLSRLFWQSHFMQKLEAEPEMEFQALHPLYNDLRAWDDTAQHHLWAWQTAQTGMPMVDACLRCLQQTGWLPFRMRAMIVSYASYQLWIPWQRFAPYLAALFTDYEPGIHYSQIQMQSGTTGINQMRVYCPVKQAQDHDANGRFIAQWLPALANVPVEYRFEPWKMDAAMQQRYGCILGRDYPHPVVEHKSAAKQAKQKLAEVRQQNGAKELSKQVFIKHGSRLSPSQRQWTRTSRAKKPTKKEMKKTSNNIPPAGRKVKNAVPENQLSLF